MATPPENPPGDPFPAPDRILRGTGIEILGRGFTPNQKRSKKKSEAQFRSCLAQTGAKLASDLFATGNYAGRRFVKIFRRTAAEFLKPSPKKIVDTCVRNFPCAIFEAIPEKNCGYLCAKFSLKTL